MWTSQWSKGDVLLCYWKKNGNSNRKNLNLKGVKILHKNYYHFRFGSKIKEAKNAELKMHSRKLVIAWIDVVIFKILLHFILKIWNQKVRNLKILWNRFIVWLISLNFCWKVGTVWKNAKFSPTFFPWKRCFHEILSKMREGEFP